MSLSVPPDHLPFTGDPEADALIAIDPAALLIGFVLDQQIPLQKAFSGPLELQRRVGTIDPRALATMDPESLEVAFSLRPALHRFPAAMARRVQELCSVIAREYDGDAARIWLEAADGRDLLARLRALPGIGEMKAGTILAILGRRFGIQPSGWEALVPTFPTLAGVDSPETLAAYQAGKRAQKAALRAQAKA